MNILQSMFKSLPGCEAPRKSSLRAFILYAGIKLLCAVFLVVLLTLGEAGEIIHEEKFAEDITGWETWRSGEGASVLSRSRDYAHSGDYSLKVETKGIVHLEGSKKSFNVEPGHRYTVTVQARGEGRVMLFAMGPGGWLYGRHTDLTPDWQELKINMYIAGSSITPNIATISNPQEVVFYLDDFKIEREPEAEAFDVEVEPRKFQAQHYPRNATIVEDDSAGEGAYAEGRRWFVLGKNMPFPLTSRPVYIYLRVWIEDNETNAITLFNRLQFQGSEAVASLELPSAKEWMWVKAGPFIHSRFVDGFSVGHSGPDRQVKARLDCVVVSTRGDLTDEELDDLR